MKHRCVGLHSFLCCPWSSFLQPILAIIKEAYLASLRIFNDIVANHWKLGPFLENSMLEAQLAAEKHSVFKTPLACESYVDVKVC